MDVFACLAPSLVCGAARRGPEDKVELPSLTAANVRLGPGLVGSREGFARLDKAAACLPVLRRAQCFRGASDPRAGPGAPSSGTLPTATDGRFKFKTRFGRLRLGQKRVD